MPLQSQLITVSNKGFLKRISDDLFQGIKKVYNTDPSERRRWIWELIQNAKDTPNDYGSVSIRIHSEEKTLTFSHNGNPFSVENIVGIIQQVSTKSSNDGTESTGKFGTGFITTHMLSRIINVSGLIVYDHQYKEFNFELNRDAETQELLLDKVEDQVKKLHQLPDDQIYPPKSISNLVRNENSFNTVFRYPLSETSMKYAQQGIDDLKATAHFALLFNDKIKQFEVQDDLTKEIYRIVRVSNTPVSENLNYVISRIEYSDHEELNEEQHILHYKNGNEFDIAVCVKKMSDGLEILMPNASTPRIFKDFPLIGTENWGSNFIVNSKKFQPTEPRNGLELHIEDDAPKTEQILNRELIQSIYNSFPALIKQMGNLKLGLTKIFVLCESSVLSNKANKHEDVLKWLKEDIQVPFRNQIKELPLVNTSTGFKTITSCKFPELSKTEGKPLQFYDICSEIISQVIPVPECYSEWYKIIKGDSSTWGKELIFNLDDLVTLIEHRKTLNQFAEFQSIDDLICWLNLVYSYICENEKIELFNHAIVPNQEGVFCKAGSLNIDNGIPESIKDCCATFGVEYRKILAKSGIICSQVIKPLGTEDISKDVNQKIGSLTQTINTNTGQHGITEPIKTSLIELCNIFINQESDIKRKSITSKLKEFFADKSDIKIDEKSKGFEFTSAIKCLTKYGLLRISQLGTIEKLREHLSFDSEEKSITWLNNLLLDVNSNTDLSELLNSFGIFPNQMGEFSFRNKLSQDVDSIDDTLKAVYSSLFLQDVLKKRLLLDGIGVYPDSKVTFAEIASKIDNCILEKEKTLPKAIILQMINWCKVHPSQEEQYFKLLKSNKARLVLQTIDGENAQEHIFRILQSNQDYDKLATIAESGVNLSEVSELVSASRTNSIEIKSILNIVRIAGTIGIEIIESLAAEKYEEELDSQFKEKVGANIEDAFKTAFEKYAVEIQIIRDPYGQDFTLVLPNGKQHSVEIKSVAHGSRRALLSKLQGRTASQNQLNYTLCVMERPSDNLYPNAQEFENLSRFVTNIGSLVEEKVHYADSIESTIHDNTQPGISIEFNNFEYKFSITRVIWQDSLNFGSFVDFIVRESA